jgi:hypothetical protein
LKWLHDWVSAGTSLFRYYLLQFLWSVLIWALYKTTARLIAGKEIRMGLEKDIKIGDVGDVDFALTGGKVVIVAKLSKKFDSSDTEVDVAVTVKQGEKEILDKIVAIFPAGALRDLAAKAEAAALALENAAAPSA